MTRTIVFLVVALLSISLAALGQEHVAEEKEAQWAETDVPEYIMKGVVQRIVSSYFKPSKTPKQVYFSDQLIRPEWLPNIEGIEFIVLTPEEISKRRQKVNFFGSVEVQEGKFRVRYGEGEGCTAGGHFWYFWVVSNKLRLWKSPNEGWGSGCGNGSGK